tara:strand:+ start:983 stop:1729 length:747 start_codon:yes stop_codon:yes gene_type:complete
MPESAKILTNVNNFNDVQKSLQELEKKINELLNSVNSSAESEVSDKDGKTGDTKITRNADASYTFEIRTEEGWKTPAMGQSLITFKDKPAQASKHKKESISDLEIDDTTKGTSNAAKNIFDESTGEFSVKHLTGVPRPDYDSGWVTWDFSEYTVGADNPLTLTHSLGALPTAVTVLFAPGQATGSVTWWSPLPSYLDSGYNHGIIYKVTSTQILLLNGDVQTYVSSDFANPGATAVYQDGSIKVLIWK